MADNRSHAIRLHLTQNQLEISSQSAEEGEASESIQVEYSGDKFDIGFNAQYLQDFLSVVGECNVRIEFKDANSQTQMRPDPDDGYDYRYIVMPMRL